MRSDAPAVLADSGKRAIYDAGLFDPVDDDDQARGFFLLTTRLISA